MIILSISFCEGFPNRKKMLAVLAIRRIEQEKPRGSQRTIDS